MGEIQSSINQALGTVAGALAAGKHLKQQAEANDLAAKNAAINAAEHIEGTVEEYGKADMEAGLKTQEIEVAKGEYEQEKKLAALEQKINEGGELTPEEKLVAATGMHQGATLRATQKNADIAELQKAQQSYQMKADAKRLQAEIYRDQINKVGKKGESLGTIKFSWEKENK